MHSDQIRPACESDIPAILDLLVQVDMVHHGIRPDLFNGPATKYTAEQLKAVLQDPASPVFVCCGPDGRALAHIFCQFQQHQGGGVMTDIKTLYIDDLCVDEKHRGTDRHIADRLFDYAVDFARKNGCYNVTLNVWAGNDRALRFYRRQGMQPQKYGLEIIL
ncbi:MAG: GNAT family N-acetyltransferase [Clostridia bacterium]|nr:GNAT family N-acetyltransferase [Clostridia bacterium]